MARWRAGFSENVCATTVDMFHSPATTCASPKRSSHSAWARTFRPAAGRTDAEEVLAAVAALHPAIEVPDSRFEDFTVVGAAQLIADNACADYFVLGPPAPAGWQSIDLAAHRVTGRVNDGAPREGVGANVLGDPREALAWLVNELSQLNVTLAASQVVTTGTCLVPLAVQSGDHVVADFGAIGTVDVWLNESPVVDSAHP